MNMQRTSGLGRIRGSKEASCHAPGEVRDPAEAGSAAATCGRARADAGRTRLLTATPGLALGSSYRSRRDGRARRRCVLLLMAAALLVLPAVAYADVLTATVTGPVTVPEGSDAIFSVTLTGGTGSEKVVVYYTVTGTATKDVDYTPPADATLEFFTANDDTVTTKTISITTSKDNVADVGETLVVTLTRVNTLKGTVALGEPKQATTTIEDKGTATVTVSVNEDEEVDEDDEGASESAEFTITLEGLDFPADANVTVSYSTVNGSATADTDYAAAEGSVTVNRDSRTATVTVATVPDTLAEGPETFMVTLSDAGLPDGVTLGIATATVTITDDDTPTVSVVGPDRVPEGSEAIFTVKLAGGTGSSPIVVYYTLGGDATRADYEPPSGSLTIPAGEAMQTLVIPTLADDVVDWDETLEVMLTRASTTTGTVTISDVVKDRVPEAAATAKIADSGIVTVSVADVTVSEEDPAVFTVTLSGEVSEDVSVRYVTDETGNATAGTDYDAIAADAADGTLTIVAGDTTGTFTVYTLHDTVAEAPESFTVRLSALAERSDDPNNPDPEEALPRGVELGAETATGTITDDDALTVSVRGPQTVAAGREVAVEYPVTLSGGTGSAPVVVNYTVSGTAADDYSPSSGTLIFPVPTATETITTRPITVTQLAEPELGETLVVTLTGTTTALGRVTLGTPRQATTAIKDANTGTLSVENVPVAEGEDAVFTVTLSASRPRDADVTIVYSTEDGSAAAGTDYAAAASGATVVIPETADPASATITVSTKEDTLAEAAETFTVTLSAQNLPDGVTLGKATATATIADNDTLTASIVGPASVGEGSEATYRVKLAGGTGSADIVVYYTVNGEAKSGEDYETPSGTLTIPSGQTEQTIVIPALSDDVLDQDETMVVTLRKANTPAGTVKRSDSAFEIETTITDTSDVFVSVAHATADEGDPMMFTVTLSGAVASDVTVSYATPSATGQGIAAADDDYTAAPNAATLVIAEGETTGTIVVATTEDTVAEADETFTVTLTEADAGARLGTATATGTIEDDDVLTVNIVGPETVVEGSSARYTATLTGGTGSDEVEVYYTVEGTATKGDDYGPPSGTLMFSTTEPSDTTTSFTITPRADNLEDDGETLVVSLTNATTTGTVNLGSARLVSTRIKDEATTVNVVADNATVAEAPNANARFTVTLSPPPTGTDSVTVRYTTANGTATADEDYADVASAVSIGTIGTATITIPILDDSLAEAPETFSVRLERVTLADGTADVVFGTATVTITDDENLTASIVGPDKVPEGSAAAFTVKLVGGTPSKPVTVYYTVGGTATKDDYRPPSGRLTIPAGRTTQTFAISTTSDNVLDRGETIDVMLTGAETAAGRVTATGTHSTMIADSSDPVTISVADISVDEGHPALFTITLSGQVSEDVTVRYDVMQGTAVAADYDSRDVNGMVTIAAGDTTGTFVVRTAQDMSAEAPETFTVTLSEESGQEELPDGVELQRTTATATIADDETLTARVVGPGTVAADVTQPVEYPVTLEGGTVSATMVVNYTVSGSASDDFAPKSGSLPIVTENSGTITLQRIGTPSENETLVVTLTSVTTSAGKATVGTPRAATSKISATGTPTVSLSVDPRVVEETEDAQFTVTLTPARPTNVTVKYETVTGGSATPNKDYTAVDSAVVIEANQTVAQFTVATIADDLAEGDETFLVKLTDATVPQGQDPVGIGTSTVIVTIPANDDDDLTASITGPEEVPEGSAANFTVRLAGGTGSEPVVAYYTVGGKATTADYQAPGRSLTIRAGAATGTIAIATTADEVLDRDETLIVTLTTLTTAAGTVARSTTEAEQSHTTKIVDSSFVYVDVADTSADEGDPATFTVTLSSTVSTPVTLAYTLPSGGSATGDGLQDCESDTGVDYDNDASSVTIPQGDTTATFDVCTVEDTVAEAAETFTVTLALTSPAPEAESGVELRDKTATATITDDIATVSIVGPATVAEGEVATFTVTLTGGTASEDVVVNYTIGGTATGADYSAPGGTVTIAAGETSATIEIQVSADDVVDLGETIEVTLTDAEPVAVGSPATATTVIEESGTVSVSIEADTEIVVEGEPVMFTVTLSGTVSMDVTLGYATTDGTSTAGDDYTAPEAGATVVVAAGDTTAQITVVTIADGTSEDDETITVTLEAVGLPEGVSLPASSASTTATITDYALIATVGPTAVNVDEGAEATLTVTLTGGANRAATVIPYTVGGTATRGDDYTPLSGTLTIPADSLTGDIAISALADSVLDNGETVVVTLGAPTTTVGVVRLGSPSAATANIVDSGTVTVSVDDGSADEGDPIEFMVTLSGLVAEPVTVEYRTAGGTATDGVDYQGVSNGTLVIPAGQNSGTFTVLTEDDNEGETTETFTVQLSLGSDTPASVTLDSRTVTATIADDDITLQPLADVTVTEGAQAPIALRLDRMTTEQVTLSYEVIAGSATFGDDFLILAPDGSSLPPIGTVDLPRGIQAGAVAVHAVDDTLAENQETFTVRVMLGNGGSPREATVTITDNDTLRVSVTGPATVAEGSAATYTVKLGGDIRGTADVAVTYTVGGTAKAADYTAPSGRVVIPAGDETASFAIQTRTDKLLEPDETLVVTLTDASTTAGSAVLGSPKSATTAIQDPVYHSINRVNQTLLPGITRASAAGALDAVSVRMALAAQGDPPAATADLTGLTGLYRALQANEQALQDGSYDLARVLGGSSFLVPLSSHDGDSGGGVGAAVWGGGDFRAIGGGDADADDVDWDGSVWSARLGADLRFVDSLLTGLAVSWTSGGLDYVDQLAPTDREGTYASWLISAYPYVGWTTPDFGLWATGGFGFGGVSIDDADEDMEAQEADLTQWSLGAGASVTVLSTESLIAGGTTALKLKAEGFLAGASVAENEDKTIAELSVGVNQARAAIEASHAQYFAGGGSLKPSLEIGGRFDGGDGETGAGIEVGGGLTYADPGSGLTVAAGGRALVIRDGNYGEWGLTGLIQLDPSAAGHGLSMSVRPTWGVTVSGVNGLWEHGTFDLLAGGQQGGRVEAEIGYGLPAFGMAGVLTPFAAGALTDAGAHSLSLGGRLELGPAFDLILEAARSDSADTEPVYDVTLEGSIRW